MGTKENKNEDVKKTLVKNVISLVVCNAVFISADRKRFANTATGVKVIVYNVTQSAQIIRRAYCS